MRKSSWYLSDELKTLLERKIVWQIRLAWAQVDNCFGCTEPEKGFFVLDLY